MCVSGTEHVVNTLNLVHGIVTVMSESPKQNHFFQSLFGRKEEVAVNIPALCLMRCAFFKWACLTKLSWRLSLLQDDKKSLRGDNDSRDSRVWSVEPGPKRDNNFWTSFELRRTFDMFEAVAQSLQSAKASALVPTECSNVLKDRTMAMEMVHKGPQSWSSCLHLDLKMPDTTAKVSIMPIHFHQTTDTEELVHNTSALIWSVQSGDSASSRGGGYLNFLFSQWKQEVRKPCPVLFMLQPVLRQWKQ